MLQNEKYHKKYSYLLQGQVPYCFKMQPGPKRVLLLAEKIPRLANELKLISLFFVASID
jgi:hypothetical protein